MTRLRAMLKRTLQLVGERAERRKRRRRDRIHVSRRAETVAELEAMYRHFVFPELPAMEGRSTLVARLEGTSASEALYLLEALHRAMHVEGDVCEFGVAQGATSALIGNEIRSTSKSLWLFDSFEGLPRPTEKDVLVDDIFNLGSMEKYAGTMAFGRDHVIDRLRDIRFDFSRVKIVPGFIEKTIRSANLPAKVSFAYVDFDLYEPISVALEYLDRAVSPGGRVVVDDYEWFSAGGKTAVDEFVSAKRGRWTAALPLPFAGKFIVLARTDGAGRP